MVLNLGNANYHSRFPFIPLLKENVAFCSENNVQISHVTPSIKGKMKAKKPPHNPKIYSCEEHLNLFISHSNRNQPPRNWRQIPSTTPLQIHVVGTIWWSTNMSFVPTNLTPCRARNSNNKLIRRPRRFSMQLVKLQALQNWLQSMVSTTSS